MTAIAALPHVPKSTSDEEILAIVAEHGAVIIEQFLGPEVVAAFAAEMAPHVAARPPGSPELLGLYPPGSAPEVDDSWGHNTIRLTRLIERSETFRSSIITDEKLVGLARQQLVGGSEHFWMSTAQLIDIGPGSVPQVLHRDLDNYPVFSSLGPAGPEVMCNFIFAITDFTEANGATRVIPGSNTWSDFRAGKDQSATIPAEMRAGDVLFFSGKVIHGGGPNSTADEWRCGLAVAFCPGFLMPEEAVPLLIDPELVHALPRRVQQLIGFRSFTQSNGARLWTADYESLAKHFGLDG